MIADGYDRTWRETSLSTEDSMGRESIDRLSAVLATRAPDGLRAAFLDELRHIRSIRYSGPELLDALHQVHAGLGVAIGRGAAGEEARYEQLGKLVAWLYEELGRPRNSQYAVVVRAAAALRADRGQLSED